MVTRFYFHSATSSVSGTLPTTEQSALTADVNADAQTVNRMMDTSIGIARASIANTTNATTSLQNFYFTRFVSNPINQTSIAANTWTYAFAATETTSNANFPVNGTNQPVYINCYVWRPTGGTKVGTILDGNSASTVDEGAVGGNTYFHIVTFSGSAVSSVVAGDVICLEIWFQVTQASASVFSNAFRFDGPTVYTENAQDTGGDASGYLETPETITFSGGLTRVVNAKTLKYNLTQQVLHSNTIKYNLLKQVKQSDTLKWNISNLFRVFHSNTLKYNLIQRQTHSNSLKYNVVGSLPPPPSINTVAMGFNDLDSIPVTIVYD